MGKRYKCFCHKEFKDLTVNEFRMMARTYDFYMDPKEMFNYYNISIEQYVDFVQSNKGIRLTPEERRLIQEHKKKHPTKTKEVSYVGVELKAMRMLRGYNTLKMAELTLLPVGIIQNNESKKSGVSGWIVDRYISVLKIQESEIKRLRALLNGETNGYEQDRQIPRIVKEKVKARDGNKCVRCQSKDKIHFHHIKPFAEGGLHRENNIILLCASCHAKEHEGEKGYYLLKKLAEG